MIESDEKVLQDNDKNVFVSELGESAVILNVRCWFNNEDYWDGRARINEEIKYTLDKHGIEIPYNQLDVHITK